MIIEEIYYILKTKMDIWEKRKYNGDNKMFQYEEGRDNELWNEWR